MPNTKIFVDEDVWTERRTVFEEVLMPIRELLCDRLGVSTGACQLALIPVTGLADQPLVNIELMILPKPERTPDTIRVLCSELQAMLGEKAETHVAVRAAALDPETYVALK